MVAKLKCGHPNDWVMKLRYGGKTYTYCMACIIEKTKVKNLEAYDNPFIDYKKDEAVIVAETKKTIKESKKTPELEN